jgi:hypothetical protein
MFHVKQSGFPDLPDVSRETSETSPGDCSFGPNVSRETLPSSTSFPQAGSTLTHVHPLRESAGASTS